MGNFNGTPWQAATWRVDMDSSDLVDYERAMWLWKHRSKAFRAMADVLAKEAADDTGVHVPVSYLRRVVQLPPAKDVNIDITVSPELLAGFDIVFTIKGMRNGLLYGELNSDDRIVEDVDELFKTCHSLADEFIHSLSAEARLRTGHENLAVLRTRPYGDNTLAVAVADASIIEAYRARIIDSLSTEVTEVAVRERPLLGT